MPEIFENGKDFSHADANDEDADDVKVMTIQGRTKTDNSEIK